MATETPIIETAAAAVPETLNAGQLSFTGYRSGDGIDLWSPAELAGDWLEHCRRGRSYGYEAVEYIRATNDCAMLQGVVRAMADRGTFGGIEVGFFAALSAAI